VNVSQPDWRIEFANEEWTALTGQDTASMEAAGGFWGTYKVRDTCWTVSPTQSHTIGRPGSGSVALTQPRNSFPLVLVSCTCFPRLCSSFGRGSTDATATPPPPIPALVVL
jgi:hypothetical protein